MNIPKSNLRKNETPSQNRSLRILVVDDSREAADNLGTLLKTQGYETFVTYGPTAALEAAKTHLPDIALLDLGLPELDGVHLARFFREDEQLRATVLVAVTGYSDEMHRRQCEAAGFNEFLPKPIDLDKLQSTITRLCSAQNVQSNT